MTDEPIFYDPFESSEEEEIEPTDLERALQAAFGETEIERLRRVEVLAREALRAANPHNEPWRCPHFAALAEALND